jgi:hypothetical protein
MTSLRKTIGQVLFVVMSSVALLKAVALLVVFGFVLTMCDAGWSRSQEVYVRNQTASPLRLTLPVASQAIQVDTIWWGAPLYGGDYQHLGYALRVTELNAEGLRSLCPVALPSLIQGKADTLELSLAGGPFAWPQEPWLTRQQQTPPAASEFAHGVVLNSLAAWPDSLQLAFPLAPDSVFRVAVHSLRLHHSDPDRLEGQEMLLPLTVQWQAPTGQWYKEQVPAAYWLHKLDAEGEQRHANTYHLKHYLNYK